MLGTDLLVASSKTDTVSLAPREGGGVDSVVVGVLVVGGGSVVVVDVSGAETIKIGGEFGDSDFLGRLESSTTTVT